MLVARFIAVFRAQDAVKLELESYLAIYNCSLKHHVPQDTFIKHRICGHRKTVCTELPIVSAPRLKTNTSFRQFTSPISLSLLHKNIEPPVRKETGIFFFKCRFSFFFSHFQRRSALRMSLLQLFNLCFNNPNKLALAAKWPQKLGIEHRCAPSRNKFDAN